MGDQAVVMAAPEVLVETEVTVADLEEVAEEVDTQAITIRIKEEDMTLTKISIKDIANMIITVMAIAVDMLVPTDWKKVQKNQLVNLNRVATNRANRRSRINFEL